MRVTKKYLSEWLNEHGVVMRMRTTVKDIYSTRYRSYDYEGGAYKTVVVLNNDVYIYSVYSFKDMTDYMSRGEELYLETSLYRRCTDWTIELTTNKKPTAVYRATQITNKFKDEVLTDLDTVIGKVVSSSPKLPGAREKADNLIADYLALIDAFAGNRERHTPTFLKRVLERTLTEVITATEIADPETAQYYRKVETIIKNIKTI